MFQMSYSFDPGQNLFMIGFGFVIVKRFWQPVLITTMLVRNDYMLQVLMNHASDHNVS